jgi:CHAT domain-containing protein
MPLSVRAQDATGDAQTTEDDYRITSIDQRRSAIAELRQSADELRQSGQVMAAVRKLNRVGRFQIRMYLADEAGTTFQQALQLLERQPDVKTEIDSLNGLASSYDNLSKCKLAEPPANTAIALSAKTDYIAGRAEALLTLSHCQNQRDHTLAMKSALESLELWRSIDRQRGIAEAHVAIGEYHMAKNDLAESGRNLQTALNLYRELNDVEQQATVLIYFGFLEYRNAAWQNALEFYTQAQALIDEKADPYRMAQITGGLAEAFLESGLPELALAKFRECLEYFRLAKTERGVRAVTWAIGKTQYMSGKYGEALESLQQARLAAASSNDSALTAFCDEFLGRTYHALHDDAAALSHFQSALAGYAKAGNLMERSRTQALMGQVYQQQGKFDRARSKYQMALNSFRTLADRINESATLHALGSLELQQNQLDPAENYLRQSIDVTENIRRASTSKDLTAAFSATVNERYQTYIECLMRKHREHPDQGFAVRAFQTSEQARARSLAELLRGVQTNLAPGLDPQLAEREKSLRQSLRAKEDFKVTLLGAKYKPEDVTALDAEVARLEADHQQVTAEIRARYPSYDQINQPTSWDLSRIQEQVVAEDQTVLLEYSLGTDHSYLWIVTRNDISSHELASEATINKAAGEVYGLLKTAVDVETERRLSEAVQTLSSMVLSPFTAQLQGRRVIVVADGGLHYIPFQILHAGSEDPLVATNEVVNAPSASILGQLRQESSRRHAPEKLVAAFGDPIFLSNYNARRDSDNTGEIALAQTSENGRLRHALRDIDVEGASFDPATIQGLHYARAELANLRDVVENSNAFVAADFDATRERLQNTDLSKFAIIHFATHGYLDPVRPENSGLVLSTVNRAGQAQEGFVGLQEIYNLRTPVDLVVLSACQTALGKDVQGEGLIGLTRGFMYAGASSVVASLWKVDDEATAELMKHFYTNMLQRGMTPAAALRQAQNTIRQQPLWRSPYFWGAFTLQGDYQHTIHSAQPPASKLRGKIIAGVMLLLLLWGAAWWWRRREMKSA